MVTLEGLLGFGTGGRAIWGEREGRFRGEIITPVSVSSMKSVFLVILWVQIFSIINQGGTMHYFKFQMCKNR